MLFLPVFFFFNDTATTEIYTLSLHDALPICAAELGRRAQWRKLRAQLADAKGDDLGWNLEGLDRSEEHTSELQSRPHLVCRLLLGKKKNKLHRSAGHGTAQPQLQVTELLADL